MAASYLLQEDGVSRFLLEDGSGFILLEDGTTPPPVITPDPGIIVRQLRVLNEEEEALLTVLAAALTQRGGLTVR